jgi:hypothetical protein
VFDFSGSENDIHFGKEEVVLANKKRAKKLQQSAPRGKYGETTI